MANIIGFHSKDFFLWQFLNQYMFVTVDDHVLRYWVIPELQRNQVI